jgi:nitroreductase
MERAIDAAILAPNSSNLQTWEFHWVHSPELRAQLSKICLNQGAARTAQELLVVIANPSLWKKTNAEILRRARASKAPPVVFDYYDRLIPRLYGWTWLSPLKWLVLNGIGLFRPVMRRPWSRRDVDEIAIKSASLAAENFMLAISAQGFDTCPMEGFDEARAKRLLGLGGRARIPMIISVGKRDPKGRVAAQERFERTWFVKKL